MKNTINKAKINVFGISFYLFYLRNNFLFLNQSHLLYPYIYIFMPISSAKSNNNVLWMISQCFQLQTLFYSGYIL